MDNNEVIIYEDKDGLTKVNVKFTGEDIWVNKYQIADVYQTTRQNIEQHINNIYKDNELNIDSTCKNLLQVQKEGNRNVNRNIDHYNLDMIIALGYRVQSDVAIRFRIWATTRLHEYIQKGFTMDDERLKQ
ncbi:MAG: RhuM family protein, partial [Bacilli bacterium]